MENPVPYIAFEAEMARHERTIKRLIKVLALVLVLLVASNIAWLMFFNSFDIVTETVSQDTDTGGSNLYGKNGAIINGTSGSENGTLEEKEP